MHSLLALLLFSYPVILNPENTKVAFEVDSTWHLIHGRAKAISGRLWLDKEGDSSSARVEAHLPVSEFDSDNSRRDKRLKEVMSAEAFPEVVFNGGPLGADCRLETLEDNALCKTTLPGTIRIKNISKEMVMNVTVRKQSNQVFFHSEGDLNWHEFGVEDPSILVAKLKKKVTVIVDLAIPMVP